MKLERTLRGFDRASVALLWLGALTLVFSLWLFYGRSFNVFPPAKAEKVTYGGAARPYSGRVLVPWTVRLALSPIPRETRRELVDRWATDHPGTDRYLAFFDSDRSFALELLLTILLDAAALLGFMLVLRKLFRSLYASSAWVERCAPVLAVLFLGVFFARFNHFLYDFPALFLFAAALVLIRERRFGWLLAVLFLGALNKETIGFVLIVYLLDELRGDRRPRWPLRLGAMALVLLVARVVAVALSAPAGAPGASGGYVRDYLVSNLLAFVRDPFLLDATRLGTLVLFLLLALAGYRRKPPFLRRIFPVVLPFLAVYVWGSLWGEIRALYELYPILFLMGYQTAVELVGLDLRGRDETEPAAAAGGTAPPAPETPALWPMIAGAAFGLFMLAAGVALATLVVA